MDNSRSIGPIFVDFLFKSSGESDYVDLLNKYCYIIQSHFCFALGFFLVCNHDGYLQNI